MIRLVTNMSEMVAKWVQSQFPDAPNFAPCTAMGVVDGNKIIAGVVYHNYHNHMIEASMASISPKWCNRRIGRALLAYPFEQLKVRRFQMTVAKRNKRMRRFLERLGFKPEGRRRAAMPDGSDAIEYSMLRHEAERWL